MPEIFQERYLHHGIWGFSIHGEHLARMVESQDPELGDMTSNIYSMRHLAHCREPPNKEEYRASFGAPKII